MKHQQCWADPAYRVRKYDRWGNIRPEWKALNQKTVNEDRLKKRDLGKKP